jgi:hypothetical protein
MMVSGLLWYDDDTHHPLAQKVAEAAQRYRERVGFEPTTCQLNPALMPSATQSKSQRANRKGASAAVIPLRLEPNEHLRPNYFYVGVMAGERLRRAVDQRATHQRRAVAGAAGTGPKPEKRGKSTP